MTKRPSFQFYPSDWRREAGLRLCSMGARGLWMEMMCIMHEATPYGHLSLLGRPMLPEELARLVGEGLPQTKKWLKELREKEVFSVAPDGLIFSRRMVRDEGVRDARAAGGASGGEHGAKGGAHGKKGGRPKNGKPASDELERGVSDEQRGVSKPPPSSSSSSSSASSPAVIDDDGDAGANRGPVAVEFPSDLIQVTAELCRAAGIRHVDPGPVIRHQSLVRGWIAEGFDPETTIAPAIREALAQTTERIGSLQFFDHPIRQFHARKEAASGPRTRSNGRHRRADEIDDAARDLGFG